MTDHSMLHTDPQIVANQIAAVNCIWRETIKLGEKVPTILDIAMEGEYQDGSFDQDLKATMLDEMQLTEFISNSEPESVRPYISDSLWNAFFVGRAFALRLHWLIREGLKTSPGQRKFWKQDIGVKQYLEQLWSEDEYSVWLNASAYSLLTTWSRFQQKILEECRKVLDIHSENEILPDKIKTIGFASAGTQESAVLDG